MINRRNRLRRRHQFIDAKSDASTSRVAAMVKDALAATGSSVSDYLKVVTWTPRVEIFTRSHRVGWWKQTARRVT